jgi:hypothetical protein
MSYSWSDKITDYYYTNPEMDTVAVLWTNPDDGLVREHYILVDEADEQWRDFAKEVSYEDIDKRTQVRHEQFREEFREAFQNYAQRNNIESDYVANQNDSLNIIFEFDHENEKHKDILFKLKLKMFEQEVVKKSKKRTAKTDIRKSETPLEAIKAYASFF